LYHINGNSDIQAIPLNKIRVLNPRNRNKKIFTRLVDSIATVGLKRPITVVETAEGYDLICGQGCFEAFQVLGVKDIPGIVVSIAEADRFLASLVENLARRRHSNKDLLEGIRILENRGYTPSQIAEKIGMSPSYVTGTLKLLQKGEERLIAAVEQGWLSMSLASTIATSGGEEVQHAMMQAYEDGTLNGERLMKVRRLIAQRNALDKPYAKGRGIEKNTTPQKLLRAYQTEVRRQKLMTKKAEINEQRLWFITGGMLRALEEAHFYDLLRAEGLLDMPQSMAKRLGGKRQ
jgi:ParB family chromosome partitioning protein